MNCKLVAEFHQICKDEESDTDLFKANELEYITDLEDLKSRSRNKSRDFGTRQSWG